MKTRVPFALTSVILILATVCILGCGGGDGRPGMLSEMGYHVGKEKVWLKSPGSGGIPYQIGEVVGADAKSFRTVDLKNSAGESQWVGIDSKRAYWGAEPFEGADPQSLTYIGRLYFRDSKTVYYQNDRISDDPANAKLVEQFLVDSKKVYFGGSVFSEDAVNFKQPFANNLKYSVDSTSVWFDISPLKGADPKTLQYIAHNFAKDAQSVFHEMNKIDDAELSTFEAIDDRYSKDAIHCFYLSLTLEDADPKSFGVINKDYAKDRTHVYYLGYLVPGADAASFEAIDDFYAKDAQSVWLNGKLIEGADAKTFKVIDSKAGKSRDAKHTYDLDKRV